jgi:hypothetical protein
MSARFPSALYIGVLASISLCTSRRCLESGVPPVGPWLIVFRVGLDFQLCVYVPGVEEAELIRGQRQDFS